MNILFDIGHPAHVHYFKNLIHLLEEKGNSVFIIARDKDVTHKLLLKLNLDFKNRGVGADSVLGKIKFLISNNLVLLKFARKVNIDLFVGFGSPYAAQVAFLLRKPSIILDDTENAKIGHLFYKNFASTILTPTTFNHNFGNKHIKFRSYMELAYLHPSMFKPNINIFNELKLKKEERFAIVRFVSWNANHDFGHSGINLNNKIKMINELKKKVKVFISSESKLPIELKKYKFPLSPEKMHDALYYATLFIGESATMASECAVLGTNAIYLDNVGRGYTDEQEKKYDLVKNFTESEDDQLFAIKYAISLLSNSELKKEAWGKRNVILDEKINLTEFLFWFVHNYPKSSKIMRENPDYQNQFK